MHRFAFALLGLLLLAACSATPEDWARTSGGPQTQMHMGGGGAGY